MRRVLFGSVLVVLSGCQCATDLPLNDAGPDASVDAGFDAGRDDAGPPDASVDAGPICTTELCDGLDNDCNGTIDTAADGGALTQLCPLQLGTCQGARVQCVGGKFPACAAEYGGKYEEFESLCDGVDNDCSGVVDVSLWRPIGELQFSTDISLSAVSVPGGWYVATGLNAQMFDEQLRPTSEIFPVGSPGTSASGAVAFGGYLNALFTRPGSSHLRRLNLDGTYAAGPDGGMLEVDLVSYRAVLEPGALTVSNDRSALLVTLWPAGVGLRPHELISVQPDGGLLTPRTPAGDGGAFGFAASAALADHFVVGLAYPSQLELQLYSPDLQPQGVPLNLPTPLDTPNCAISSNTTAIDAGLDQLVAICPDARRMYGAEDPFAGGSFTAFWEADAGTIANVSLLPSYARATAFWTQQVGARTTFWMGQVNGMTTALAEIAPHPSQPGFAPSIRGGYLMHGAFDGGQGSRPYGAYVCPP